MNPTASRCVRGTVLTAATALALGGLLGTAAQAAPTYEESIQLSWDGVTYTAVTAGTFVGTPVTVPGDRATRTLTVRNDGPTAGTLRATILNVVILDPDAPDVHHNAAHVDPDGSGGAYTGAGDQGRFYDDLMLDWSTGTASFTQLDADGETQILEVVLGEGESVPITIGYALPEDATSGNRANVAPRLASFDVLLEIGGELPSEPPTAAPPVAPPPAAGAPLPATGADVQTLGLLAALAVVAGALLAVLARRRGAHRG